MYENIPSELLVTVFFNLIDPDDEHKSTLHKIEHVNVQELVGAIRLLSQEDVDSLFALGCIDINSHCPPAKMDDRIQMIFAHLVNGLFKIMPEALTCNFFSGNPETPAQSAMCTLRSIIDAQKKQVKEDVARRVEELFNPGNKQAVLSLPEILPASVPKFSIDAWINSH